MRLDQKPDGPDIIIALVPVLGMDLTGFRITGDVGLDLVDDEAGIGEYLDDLTRGQPVYVLHLIAEQPLPGVDALCKEALASRRSQLSQLATLGSLAEWIAPTQSRSDNGLWLAVQAVRREPVSDGADSLRTGKNR